MSKANRRGDQSQGMDDLVLPDRFDVLSSVAMTQIITSRQHTLATITFSTEAGVAVLTPELVAELSDSLHHMNEDVNVAVIILSGVGKRVLHQANGLSGGDADLLEYEAAAEAATHPDTQEGFQAFMQKRAPQWQLKIP